MVINNPDSDKHKVILKKLSFRFIINAITLHQQAFDVGVHSRFTFDYIIKIKPFEPRMNANTRELNIKQALQPNNSHGMEKIF